MRTKPSPAREGPADEARPARGIRVSTTATTSEAAPASRPALTSRSAMPNQFIASTASDIATWPMTIATVLVARPRRGTAMSATVT